MISTLQCYKTDSINLNIDIAKIPTISPSLDWAVSKIKIQLPPDPKTLISLKSSMAPIQETEKILQETKDHGTRIKAIAVLKIALVVAVIAGIILSCTLGGPVGLILGLLLGFFALGILYRIYIETSLNKIIDIERRDPNSASSVQAKPIWGMTVNVRQEDQQNLIAKFTYPLIALPIYPIYEAFTREARLQKVLDRQKDVNGVYNVLARFQEKNSRLIPNAYNFYKNESEKIFALFEKQIEQSRKDLEALMHLSERLPSGETELRNRIDNYETAKNELKAIQQFYLQTAQK